ncbi:hypothetical protein BSZ37_18835 [Rubrivirga marina]|uniref:Deoxyribose-phosphate aldolase n=1 Tax=Rubrivirga marina TaxID=1196024 RepID=A0A271J736_9BACT|nr:hypothetical protein BSZ37_18835 [Rubrivirga marina]
MLAACERPAPQGDPEALALLDRARAHHGSALLDDATVRFAFRGTPFVAERDGGRFRYSRTLTDERGRVIEEVVDNDGAHRFVDGVEAPLTADGAAALTTGVNSVVYFALLPAPLADPAVRARLLTPDRVGGEDYDRVEVTFAQNGGGADYQDRYVYWLRQSDGQIGHYAYTYEVTPGDTARAATGTRFRVPIRTWREGGVVFQDWRNLSADSLGALRAFGDAYDAGRTFEVSTVVLDSVRVER